MNTKKLNNQNPSSEKLKDNYNFLLINQNNLSKKYYQNIVAYDLILKQNHKSIMRLARMEKIVLNTSSKTYVSDKKYILFTLAALELLSGQKPQLTYARKSVANFKVRQHQIIGCKVVLQQNSMYTFLDKLSKIIFPRIRDYSKKKSIIQTNKKTFLLNRLSTYSLGFQNMMIFPELENHYELIDNFRGMNLTFVLLNSNKNTNSLLLSAFQLPVLI